jgi:hypothetical protein
MIRCKFFWIKMISSTAKPPRRYPISLKGILCRRNGNQPLPREKERVCFFQVFTDVTSRKSIVITMDAFTEITQYNEHQRKIVLYSILSLLFAI